MSLCLTSIQAWRIHSEVTPCKLTGIDQNSQCIWVFFCIACFTWVRPPLRQICFTFLVHLFKNKPICGGWQFNKYLWSLICACWVLGLFFARTVLKSNVLLVGYLEFGKVEDIAELMVLLVFVWLCEFVSNTKNLICWGSFPRSLWKKFLCL